MLCNNVDVRRCLYLELGLPVFLSAHFPFSRLICNLSLPLAVFAVQTWLNWRPTRNGRLVRWLAASFFSNRPRRFWITWNHLSNCRGLRPIELDRGVGSRKLEIGSRKPKVGSRKWRRSGKWEVRSLTMQHWVWAVRNQKSGVRTLSTLKSEVWSMKSEAGRSQDFFRGTHNSPNRFAPSPLQKKLN